MSHRFLKLTLTATLTLAGLHAADFAKYREFSFGESLTTVTREAGLSPTAIRVAQKRPMLIQEADWQPHSVTLGSASKPESVREGVLSFLNGELFRIVVTYDRYRIEGMTADDMTEAISRTYGTATHPTAEIAFRSSYGDTAAVLARWEDANYTYDLVRTGDRASFAMVLYSKKLNAQAEASIVEAARLDLAEAPQRELDRQKKTDEDALAAAAKNRAANKPNFRP